MNVNRRYFLLGSAVAARAASGQTGERLGTAVIGTGSRGSYLLRGVIEQPVAKVTALCDIKPDRLDKAATAAAKDNPATTNDWRKVLERKDVDVVFIATPPYLHSEMAAAALQAGKHVYCEKPIGDHPGAGAQPGARGEEHQARVHRRPADALLEVAGRSGGQRSTRAPSATCSW